MSLIKKLFPAFFSDEEIEDKNFTTHQIISFPSHEDMAEVKNTVHRMKNKDEIKKSRRVELEKQSSLRSDYLQVISWFDRHKQRLADQAYRSPLKWAIDTRVEKLLQESKKKDFMNVINKC